MSYDESDEDGEWEVVDIIETSTSVNPSKKPKAAKQEDVDKLAADMQAQLSFKSTQLEEKLRHQERLSQQQMAEIQSKLSQIARIQTQQEKQQKDLDQQRQQMLLEQRIKIESLSELTQKQIADAQEKIQRTQQATQNVTENVQTLQQLQHLNQLAQLQQLNQAQVAQPSFNNMTIPPPPLQPQPQVQPPYGSHGTLQSQPEHNQHNALYSNPISNADHHPLNGNGTLNNNSNSNGWLPSFFVFGNKGSNATNTSTDLHMTSSPNISTTVTTSINHGHMNHGQSLHAAEEKANILGDEDDDEVLEWNNEYGHNASSSAMHSPLNSQLTLLKTKCVIGEGKFRPSEERQCGWILQNKSRSLMKMTAKLECIGGDEDGFGIRVSTEKEYEFTLKPEEEVFILIEVKAPGIVGRYCSFYQLVMENGVKVGDTLEVLCEVEAQFNKSKEDKIASLIKMGFDDRKKVVQVLEKKKWNVQQSVDVLIAM